MTEEPQKVGGQARTGRAEAPAPPRACVLLVEDNSMTGDVLVAGLAAHGYAVEIAPTLRRARRRLGEDRFDVVLLDIRLPDGSGLELLNEIRADSALPVIVVSGADSLADRVAGFDAGADDYVVKPLYPLELARRLDAVLRRAGPPAAEMIAGPDGLMLNVGNLEVTLRGHSVRLTRSEAGLLRALLERPGVALPSDDLSRRIWNYESAGDPNFIQQHISRLRRKLRSIGAEDVITTIYGVGYAIGDPEPGQAADPERGPA